MKPVIDCGCTIETFGLGIYTYNAYCKYHQSKKGSKHLKRDLEIKYGWRKK